MKNPVNPVRQSTLFHYKSIIILLKWEIDAQNILYNKLITILLTNIKIFTV